MVYGDQPIGRLSGSAQSGWLIMRDQLDQSNCGDHSDADRQNYAIPPHPISMKRCLTALQAVFGGAIAHEAHAPQIGLDDQHCVFPSCAARIAGNDLRDHEFPATAAFLSPRVL